MISRCNRGKERFYVSLFQEFFSSIGRGKNKKTKRNTASFGEKKQKKKRDQIKRVS